MSVDPWWVPRKVPLRFKYSRLLSDFLVGFGWHRQGRQLSEPGRESGYKTKRKLQPSSPPNRKVKGGKSSKADCLIYEELILEADNHCIGDEAVLCEDDCQGWLHWRCAGISHPAFDKLSECNNVYNYVFLWYVCQQNIPTFHNH